MSIVCLADTHHPYHHQPSIDWALTMVKSLKAKRIVLLGDHIDLYSISRFSKDPTKRNIKKEIDSVKRFFKDVDNLRIETTLILGNHEKRYYKYLWDRAPEFASLKSLDIREAFNIPKRWNLIGYNKRAIHKNIVFFHGNKSGVSLLDKNLSMGMSSVQGHSHYLAVKHRRMADYRIIGAASAGTNWQRGIVVCYSSKDIRSIVSPF